MIKISAEDLGKLLEKGTCKIEGHILFLSDNFSKYRRIIVREDQ